MAFKYFNVKNGLVTGNILLHAGNGTVSANTFSGNINATGNANLGNVSNVKITGGNANFVLRTDGTGNLSWVDPSTQSAKVYFQSNVSEIVAGSTLAITADYANTEYPGGLFTLVQLGPVSTSLTSTWQSSNSSSKNAYANLIANSVNTSNIRITLSLANANFSIQSSDTITIGSSVITGSNLANLGISGTGGTYTIPSTLLDANVQINSSSSVSANLTTTRGSRATTGTALTTIAPVPFNVTSLTGSFASSSVPYWSLNQTFNWTAALTSGAVVASGNLTYSNATLGVSGSLSTTGATSGTSTSLDSTYAYTITTSDYTGAGGFGAGTRTMPSTVVGTVSAATKYYPLFWKITQSSSVPTFTTSDSRNSNNFAVGQSASTTANPSDYLWIATPNSNNRTFKHIFLGSDIIDTPAASGDITISGQAYKAWGFTNFSAITSIIVTS